MKNNLADISKLNVKNFVGSIGLLSISSILKFFVQFAIIIIYAKRLPLSDYGVYQFIWMFINFFSVVGLFGLTALVLSTSVYDIIIWIKAKRKLLIIITLAINTIAVVYLFAFNSFFTFTERILLLILLLFQNTSLLTESIAIKNGNIKKLLLSNLVYLLIYGSVHYYAIYHHYSLGILLAGIVLATYIKSCLLLVNYKNENRKITALANIGIQWFYLGMNDSLGILVKWMDKWIVLAILPTAQFAIYFNGTYEVPVFMVLLGAVGSISLVEISKDNQIVPEKIKSIFEESSTLLAAIIFPSFWFLLFYSKDLFQYLFGDKYLLSVPIFQISLFILPLRILSSTSVLQAFHKSQLIVKGALLDLIIAVILMPILYHFYKMQGLAFSFVLSTYVQVAYYLWHTSTLISRKISFFIPFKRLCYLLATSFAIVAATSFLSKNMGQQAFVIVGGIICFLLIATLLALHYRRIRHY